MNICFKSFPAGYLVSKSLKLLLCQLLDPTRSNKPVPVLGRDQLDVLKCKVFGFAFYAYLY